MMQRQQTWPEFILTTFSVLIQKILTSEKQELESRLINIPGLTLFDMDFFEPSVITLLLLL